MFSCVLVVYANITIVFFLFVFLNIATKLLMCNVTYIQIRG